MQIMYEKYNYRHGETFRLYLNNLIENLFAEMDK